mgnify:CR=1 FL=1
MNKVIPKIMPGFMELLPEDQILFNEIVDTIRKTYEEFGFLPLDTPVLEYSEILLAKAGGETEKQIYRFKKGENDISLRFDLTVPLARYVSQRYNDLVFPFKRYQIGKVYRGERPQKGRYREFYQCDIDIINENLNILYDAEMPAVIYNVFKKLNFGKFTIRLNNRKVLNGFFNSLDLEQKVVNVLRVIDKLEKIGLDKVKEELSELSIKDSVIDKIINFVTISGTNNEILDALKGLKIENDLFKTGLEELEQVISSLKFLSVDESYYVIDLTIARGLDYYTGTIYETKLDDYLSIGSICSGGRYDNLADFYTDKKLQGVGISIGLTRLFYKLKEAGIIKSNRKTLSKVLILPFDQKNLNYSLKVSTHFRNNNINCDVYYENKNLKQKLKYANRLGIPYVCIIGDDEEKENKVTIKNMETGEQSICKIEEAIKELL